ncbi:MAG: S8 family peptidase [Gemmatimonadota bacterium]
MKRYASLLAVLALAACQDDATAPAARTTPLAYEVAADGSIPGHYIVVADWDADAAGLATDYGLQPRHVFEHLLNGFSAQIPDDVVQALAADARVLRLSVQRQFTKLETVTPAGSWGIDRVDQRNLPIDGLYAYDVDASDVRAYVIDTGMRTTHVEFEARATKGFDAFANDPTDPELRALLGDGECDLHATHVGGTIGGKTFGIAKGVNIVSVRVLNCVGFGSDADVIAGMDWVAKNGVLPAVANMSLGDVVPSKKLGLSTEIDNAVKTLVASGVSLSIAAGNGYGLGAAPGYDACDYPLANVPEAITVGATRRSPSVTDYTFDQQTAWTSFGACVDIYAPGQTVRSSLADSDVATGDLSGTSMATPHVAGVAALVLAQSPGATPAEVQSIIVSGATPDVIQKNPNNTTASLDPNPVLMLYSRVRPPDVKKNGKPWPCTPKRQREGQC